MNISKRIIISMLIFLFASLSSNMVCAFDHGKLTSICKASIEQNNNLSIYKNVRHYIKGVKGQGNWREYRIKTKLTSSADEKSEMLCKCKITTSGEIKNLEMISS